MDLLKKHIDMIIVLSALFSSFLWMNGKFNSIEKDMAVIRQEIAVMKTIMVMNGHYPKEMVVTASSQEK